MKTRKLAWLGLVPMAAIMFFACQKNDLNPSLTSEAKGGKGGGVITPQNVSLPPYSLSADDGVVGEPLTITLNFNPNPNCGTARIEIKKDEGGNITYDGTGEWVSVATFTDWTALPFTHQVTPTQTGFISVRGHFIPQGPDCDYNGQPSSTLPVYITDGDCHEGLFAEVTDVEAYKVDDVQQYDAKGNPYFLFTVTFNLNTCDNNYLGKLQGGLVKGAEIVRGVPETYSVKSNAQSNVITWDNVGTGHYTVIYKVARASCNEAPITGAWSFKWNGGQYDYTTPLTFGFCQ